jgi:hypothetical protein
MKSARRLSSSWLVRSFVDPQLGHFMAWSLRATPTELGSRAIEFRLQAALGRPLRLIGSPANVRPGFGSPAPQSVSLLQQISR